MNETRYPLCWPAGWKRTPANERKRATFGARGPANEAGYRWKNKLTIWTAWCRVAQELRALQIEESDVIVSTNVQVRLDGVPRSDRAEPRDPGTAVYWMGDSGKKQCMAIDRYDRVADNLAAVAATLGALRAIERHGGGSILERAFIGFAALPAAIVTQRPWRDVLQLQFDPYTKISAEMIQNAYRALVARRHPDVGGSHESMIELNAARDAALAEVGS